MDRFIAKFDAEADGDLMLCHAHGVAYQKDRACLIEYGPDYFDTCLGYEDKDIARKINAGRIALVNRHVGLNSVVDIGIGSGEFIKKRGGRTFGVDVNPVAIEWLKHHRLWADRLDGFAGYTFWDVLEHVETPETYLGRIDLHAFLFTSVPIFDGLDTIRASRHYRPGEHLYYWTDSGFVRWLDLHGFQILERQTFEMDAGRDSIHSYAFRRYRWPKS